MRAGRAPVSRWIIDGGTELGHAAGGIRDAHPRRPPHVSRIERGKTHRTQPLPASSETRRSTCATMRSRAAAYPSLTAGTSHWSTRCPFAGVMAQPKLTMRDALARS